MIHPIRTFLDSGVLIYAYKGQPHLREPALRVLRDPRRVFLSSPFVRHEVSPKALFNKQQGEYRFYLLDADEFITTEKPGKSVYRSALIKVVYLFQ